MSDEAETIINTYKQMSSECKQILTKIQELTMDKDEHRLVVETLSKLESNRRAFRLIGGILVERSVGDLLPIVSNNHDGVSTHYHYIPLFITNIFNQY